MSEYDDILASTNSATTVAIVNLEEKVRCGCEYLITKTIGLLLVQLLHLLKAKSDSLVSAIPVPRFDGKGLQHQADTLTSLALCLDKIERGVNIVTGVINQYVVIAAVAEARGVIKDRLKLLKIADREGWDAVTKYLGSSDIGDDAFDAKKIQRSIDKVLSDRAAIRRSKPKAMAYGPYPGKNRNWGGGYGGYGGFGAYGNSMAQSGHPINGGTFFPKMAPGVTGKWGQKCYECGKFGHWKIECHDRQGPAKK